MIWTDADGFFFFSFMPITTNPTVWLYPYSIIEQRSGSGADHVLHANMWTHNIFLKMQTFPQHKLFSPVDGVYVGACPATAALFFVER